MSRARAEALSPVDRQKAAIRVSVHAGILLGALCLMLGLLAVHLTTVAIVATVAFLGITVPLSTALLTSQLPAPHDR
jgi:uncharacterized membrane protein HdeD (DUF308 family)